MGHLTKMYWEHLTNVFTYLIFVNGTTGSAGVKFSGWCQKIQITAKNFLVFLWNTETVGAYIRTVKPYISFFTWIWPISGLQPYKNILRTFYKYILSNMLWRCVSHIHSKSSCRWCPDSAEDFNFPRTEKTINSSICIFMHF